MRPTVLHLVTNHHIHTMNQVLDNVLQLGYRRVGLCIPRDWNDKVEKAWQSALLLFQEEHPELPRIPVLWESYEKKALRAWMKQNPAQKTKS